MAYQRWYDKDPRLSAVVKSMEFMNDATQRRFADKLLTLSEELMAERGGYEYIEKLDPNKKDALGKAQSNKKRWYDQYESLHRAFNNLYALPMEDRREIAARLSTPIDIVAAYERHCTRQRVRPDLNVVEEILRTSLQDGAERARKLYALYTDDFRHELETANKRPYGAAADRGMWTALLENLQDMLAPA